MGSPEDYGVEGIKFPYTEVRTSIHTKEEQSKGFGVGAGVRRQVCDVLMVVQCKYL